MFCFFLVLAFLTPTIAYICENVKDDKGNVIGQLASTSYTYTVTLREGDLVCVFDYMIPWAMNPAYSVFDFAQADNTEGYSYAEGYENQNAFYIPKRLTASGKYVIKTTDVPPQYCSIFNETGFFFFIHRLPNSVPMENTPIFPYPSYECETREKQAKGKSIYEIVQDKNGALIGQVIGYGVPSQNGFDILPELCLIVSPQDYVVKTEYNIPDVAVPIKKEDVDGPLISLYKTGITEINGKFCMKNVKQDYKAIYPVYRKKPTGLDRSLLFVFLGMVLGICLFTAMVVCSLRTVSGAYKFS